MQPSPSPDVERVAPLLWLSMLVSTLIITTLAWWLPNLIDIQPIPGVAMPLAMVALAAVPSAYLIARVLGISGKPRGANVDGSRPRGLDAAPKPNLLGLYLVVLAVAEFPAFMGLVYVFVGGATSYALGLGALSVGLLLAFSPRVLRNA